MSNDLSPEQTAAITMLLQSGKTTKEIASFAGIDVQSVLKVARALDLEPDSEVQRKAKALYTSPKGLSFQQIAKDLAADGFTADGGAPMHHLTIASWVKNYGWAWGGSADGDYAPERAASAPVRSRFVRRLSKSLDAELNSTEHVDVAAETAWSELSEDKTNIVQLAIIRGAAVAGVTDLAAVKKRLLDAHGDEIRSARADPA